MPINKGFAEFRNFVKRMFSEIKNDISLNCFELCEYSDNLTALKDGSRGLIEHLFGSDLVPKIFSKTKSPFYTSDEINNLKHIR